jgi:flagellar biosynthesis/type III secretory pathway chaperone
MDSNADRRLEAVLDREIEVARRLAATLAAEREALTGSSPLAVDQHAAEKVALFGTFEDLERERRALWEPSPQADPGPAARWQALMELMAQCRKANEINGYIINVRRGQVRQLIDVVRGGAPPLIYGPAGKTGPRAQRPLARA